MAGNLSEVQTMWILKQNAFGTPPPTHYSVVNAPKTGRPRISVTGENEMRVLTFMNSLKKSTWRVSQELSIPRMTTQIFGCKNQIWSDEARSKLSGYVNRYNCLNQPDMLHNVVVSQLATRADYNNYLDNIFPQYWIRRCGSIDWLTRSPDLTSRDGFWGGVKEKVLRRFPNSELFIELISQAFLDIDASWDLCAKVCQSVRDGFQEDINVVGGHFEHLRD
uniref:Uncharacterized protein n=1 Tax=Paramormyrops kingsleyae TaxID=1676925 RepID=A0A3B3T9C7_9TELE